MLVDFLQYLFIFIVGGIIFGVALLYWAFMFYTGKDAALNYLDKKEIPR